MDNHNQQELELTNPLVLATVATVSLGLSLIAYQNVSTLAAWAVGVPVAISFVLMLPNLFRATRFIASVAYDDIRGLFATDRSDIAREWE